LRRPQAVRENEDVRVFLWIAGLALAAIVGVGHMTAYAASEPQVSAPAVRSAPDLSGLWQADDQTRLRFLRIAAGQYTFTQTTGNGTQISQGSAQIRNVKGKSLISLNGRSSDGETVRASLTPAASDLLVGPLWRHGASAPTIVHLRRP
jgi:hypothetical protein